MTAGVGLGVVQGHRAGEPVGPDVWATCRELIPAGGVFAFPAEVSLDAHGRRYAEGLLLLLRARMLQARGEPVADVRITAERGPRAPPHRGFAFMYFHSPPFR